MRHWGNAKTRGAEDREFLFFKGGFQKRWRNMAICYLVTLGNEAVVYFAKDATELHKASYLLIGKNVFRRSFFSHLFYLQNQTARAGQKTSPVVRCPP